MKHSIKPYIAAILGVVVVLLAAYLFGAFVAADFDFRNWSKAGRAELAMMTGFVAFIAAFAAYDLTDVEKPSAKNGDDA